MDTIDRKIVNYIQNDSRLSQAELAEKVGLTVSSVHDRLKKLERKGVIRKYVALADPDALGKPILAFIRLSVQIHSNDHYTSVGKNIQKLCDDEADILECHHVAGEDCYILKVRARDPKGLEALLGRVLQRSSASRSITNLVFSTCKESTEILPME